MDDLFQNNLDTGFRSMILLVNFDIESQISKSKYCHFMCNSMEIMARKLENYIEMIPVNQLTL